MNLKQSTAFSQSEGILKKFTRCNYKLCCGSQFCWESKKGSAEKVKRLHSVQRHKFCHFVEFLAGENGLEIGDAEFIFKYLQMK